MPIVTLDMNNRRTSTDSQDNADHSACKITFYVFF